MDQEIMTIKNRRIVVATLRYMLSHGELELREVFGRTIAHSKPINKE